MARIVRQTRRDSRLAAECRGVGQRLAKRRTWHGQVDEQAIRSELDGDRGRDQKRRLALLVILDRQRNAKAEQREVDVGAMLATVVAIIGVANAVLVTLAVVVTMPVAVFVRPIATGVRMLQNGDAAQQHGHCQHDFESTHRNARDKTPTTRGKSN